MSGRCLPRDATGAAKLCPTCGARASHGLPGNPDRRKNKTCPTPPPTSRETHRGPWNGAHSGPLETCASRYCQEAAAGGRIPLTANPEHILRAASIRIPLTHTTTRTPRFTTTLNRRAGAPQQPLSHASSRNRPALNLTPRCTPNNAPPRAEQTAMTRPRAPAEA